MALTVAVVVAVAAVAPRARATVATDDVPAWPRGATAAIHAPPTHPDLEPRPDHAVGVAVPVLLLPGWFNDAADMEPLRRRFLEAGWDPARVATVGFHDPVGSNRTHAREVARAVLALKERTGAPRVDVVAHSMGGLALRYYLWSGGADDVRRAVFLATPHRGTVASYLAWGDGAVEMRPGSPFLVSITRAPALPPEVDALTVRTPLDLHVLPAESATLPGVADVEVCCPTHEGMLDDPETFDAVRRFLDGA